MGRVGRPNRSLETKAGTITGLCPLGNGRWRITLPGPHKGRRFNEHDEQVAIARFRKIVGDEPTVDIAIAGAETTVQDLDAQLAAEIATPGTAKPNSAFADATTSTVDAEGRVAFSHNVKRARMLEWARNLIIADRINAAKELRLPGIATLDITEKAATPLKLATIIDTYDKHGTANWRTRGQARAAFKRLRAITGAETADDLTTASLIAFRAKVNEQLAPAGASQVFAKIKAVFSFAVKYGLDASQLTPALGRLKTLYAPPATSQAKPQPISKADFRKLVTAADTEWRAILLLSLNMALYLEDVCTLRWDDFDLKGGTYSGKRGKTNVVRVGVLWSETIAALKSLPRKGQSPLLFTSATGLRFNASSKYDTFASLRGGAGVAAQFSSIRDGGYTAVAASCDEKTAKLFAAHRFGGLMDSYVKRRPELVKSAAEAVYRLYGPFPTPKAT